MSQAPQKFRCSEKQATCEGCFTRQSVYSVISLHFGMSRAVHPQIQVDVDHKLQALVYDILPSTTAVFSYAIGSRKRQLTSSWCSNSSKFVTNSSNKTRHVIYSRQQSLHQHKQNHNRFNRDGTLLLPGMDGSRAYMRAWALGCF